jgi:hypothetical protein
MPTAAFVRRACQSFGRSLGPRIRTGIAAAAVLGGTVTPPQGLGGATMLAGPMAFQWLK